MNRDDLSVGQKLLRSLGLTLLVVTGVMLLGLAYGYVSGGQGEGWKQVVSALALAAAAVAVFSMLVDSIDFWMLGRRMTAYSLKMTRSLVFVIMLAAVGLSLLGGTPGLLLVMSPALMVYLFGVVRGTETPLRPASPAQRRQKRGGKKRK